MGHLYVIHGDLTKVAADAVLVPCDAGGEVLSHWSPFDELVTAHDLAQQFDNRSRVSRLHGLEHLSVRFVDTGGIAETADVAWLAAGIRAGVEAAITDVRGRTAQYGRGRTLIAMPIFGVGAGGFDAHRGDALDAQLREVRSAIDGVDVDAVIVCWERSDYVAMQSRREPSQWSLSGVLEVQAGLLAAAARDRRLALFLGAGVSVAAGIGDFASLVTAIEKDAAGADNASADVAGSSSAELAARIDKIQERHDEVWVRERIREAIRPSRYALLHGLLASLQVDEAVTTNFDQLYETAGTRPFADSPLAVLPWERPVARSPWLLKAHGDPIRQQRLVLDSASFANFETERPTIAGLVRSLFTLGREVLFIGYSLSDENMKRLVVEAVASYASFDVGNVRLGTVIDLEAVGDDPAANPVKLGLRIETDTTFVAATLRLQEFVDHIGWLVARDGDSWLLDDRFGALHSAAGDRDFAQQLTQLAVPAGPTWQSLRTALARWGRRPNPLT